MLIILKCSVVRILIMFTFHKDIEQLEFNYKIISQSLTNSLAIGPS